MDLIHKFFIITPLDTETQALLELEALIKCNPELKLNQLQKVHGGIEGEGEIASILSLNYYLKIPTRILLRLALYPKIKDFPKLYQKIKKFPWNKYVGHPEPIWKVSSRKSKLIHTGRIEETCISAYQDELKAQPLKETWKKEKWATPLIFIRFDNDELTISLDTSGESLYKRGNNNIKGEAPIRENLASWLLSLLLKNAQGSVELMDPMCGSGTFLIEGLFQNEPSTKRSFQFEMSPLAKFKLNLNFPSLPFEIKSYIGLDQNEDLINKLNIFTAIHWHTHDLIKTPAKVSSKFPLYIITNPPYGERLSLQNRMEFFKDAWIQLMSYKPQGCLMLIPSDFVSYFKDKYKGLKFYSFKNGGLPVTAISYHS